MRVGNGDDCACNACGNQGIRTWRRTALKATRLKAAIKCCAACVFTCRFQRIDFGVLEVFVKEEAFANDASIAYQHCADGRVWAHLSFALRRQFKRPLHELLVKFTHSNLSCL